MNEKNNDELKKLHLMSLRYTYLHDGRTAIANNIRLIGHVDHAFVPDEQLMTWITTTAGDVSEDTSKQLVSKLIDNVTIVKRILDPGQSLQVDDASAIMDPRTLVERRVYEKTLHRLLTWMERGRM